MDIIFDLDGTLADNTHRRQYVTTKPRNWDAFFANIEADSVIEPVAQLMKCLVYSNTIIICSGRPDYLRDRTEKWLFNNGLGIHYTAMYMRATDDFRADDVVKSELLDQIIADGYSPTVAFDDRSRVIAMWRKRGLIACQVAEGDF